MSVLMETKPKTTKNYKVIFNFKPVHNSEHVEKRAAIVTLIDGCTSMEDIPSILEARWSGEVTEVLSTTVYDR